MSDLSVLARIDDPAFYNDPFEIYRRIRAEDPVLEYEPLKTWVLGKYQDVCVAARDPETFSNSGGIFLTDAVQGESVGDDYFGDQGELISSLDHPRHSEIRRVIAPAFSPKVIDEMEDSIRADCVALIDQIEPDVRVDWIASVAEKLPLIVIARLLGLPGDNLDELARWSDEIMKFGQVMADEERAESIATFSAMNDYLINQLEAARTNRGNDVLSVLLSAEEQYDHITLANILALASTIVAGGNETTRALLGNMIWALIQHPEQLDLLHTNPSLAQGAVLETLRWKGPVHGFIRKVMRSVSFRGKELQESDFVYLLYSCANRDEEIWEQPDEFLISRPLDTANLAFGVGPHRCPGNRLARLEARVLLEELVKKFPKWELAGAPNHIESLFRNGFYDLPVVFRR
jgi:cytochrome P450